MLVSHAERPRELKWYHAGPMLYGDWGTSRFYVLGLAFFYTLHASFWYVLGVGALVACVGWAYTIICRCYPDGGGVYSAARHTSQQLAVVGALLLFADYIVTAAISAYDGMHYLGIPDRGMTVAFAAMGSILLIGFINYIGPRKAGTFALVVALATLALTLVIGAFSIPHLATGWHNIVSPRDVPGTPMVKWDNLVKVILALSGVEAIANMTGIMVPPVPRTSKKSIYPVLIEVVVLNLLFAVAMNALPQTGSHPAADYDAKVTAIKEAHRDWESNPAVQAEIAAAEPSPAVVARDDAIKNKVMRVLAAEYVHPYFAWVCGIVFGLLLLSAVNTAVMDMISIQYVMSRDTELPRFFQRLNKFGVPWAALLPAVGLPIAMLVIFHDLETLGDLYAIGVIGAIAINLGSCSVNRKMPVKMYERAAMGVLAAVLLAVEATLVWEKPYARYFALSVVTVGLTLRYAAKAYPAMRARRKALAAAGGVALAPTEEVIGTPAEQLDMRRAKVLVATRGGRRLLEFAANYCRKTEAVMLVLFVRQIAVVMMGTAEAPEVTSDEEAMRAFTTAAEVAKAQGVQMLPIYVVSSDVPYTILDFAATYDVEAVLMGVSREGTLLRALRGDVIAAVADDLPGDISLLIHA